MNRFDYAKGKLKLPPCFDSEFMRERIAFDNYKGGHLNLAQWIDEVPSRYRDLAVAAAKRVSERYMGKKTVNSTLNRIIEDIRTELQNDPRLTL